MKDILYNCRKATFLIEKKSLATISVKEQVELKLHLAACAVCRLYQQQSSFISQIMKKQLGNGAAEANGLEHHFKEELARKIKVKMADHGQQ